MSGSMCQGQNSGSANRGSGFGGGVVTKGWSAPAFCLLLSAYCPAFTTYDLPD